MNKSHLIEKVAKEVGISKVAADKVIDTVIAGVCEALSKGERVTFVNFGSFTLGERSARAGRNPQTGEAINIEARKFVRFTIGKKLDRQVNQKRRDHQGYSH